MIPVQSVYSIFDSIHIPKVPSSPHIANGFVCFACSSLFWPVCVVKFFIANEIFTCRRNEGKQESQKKEKQGEKRLRFVVLFYFVCFA